VITQQTTRGKKVMKQVLQSQKIWTSLVALGLAVLITVFAAFNSFGVPSNDGLSEEERIEMEILNRAYADIQPDATIQTEQPIQKIKIFDVNNKLIGEATLATDKVIEDKNIQILLNKAEFLSQYGSLSVYRITE
jgi:hypothetical protein